jgi:hypothetical protein
MLPKPVILFHGILLGARCYTMGFQAGKDQGTQIILMNLDVHVSNNAQTDGGAELMDHVHNR